MQTAFANQSSAVRVDLIVGGNYIDPDDGEPIKYTVYGKDFTPIPGYVDKIVEVPSEGGETEQHTYHYPNTFVLNIPAEVNALSEGLRVELRTVVVSFFSYSRQYFLKYTYRVCEFPAYSATNDDVRMIFGLNNSDLADDLIDLDGCYFDLIEKYPSIEEMFKSGGLKASKANRILALTCALKYANGLSLLAVGTESDGTSKIARFEKGLNFEGQIAGAKAELEGLLSDLFDVDVPSVNLFLVGTTEDIFTGS